MPYISDKYNLTQEEKEILKALKTLEFKYIARDADGQLYAYDGTLKKDMLCWRQIGGYDCFQLYANQFKFIKWEDNEPCAIDELLKL